MRRVVEDDTIDAIRLPVRARPIDDVGVRVGTRIEERSFGNPRDVRVVAVAEVHHRVVAIDRPVVHGALEERHDRLSVRGAQHGGPAGGDAGAQPAIEVERVAVLLVPLGDGLQHRRDVEVAGDVVQLVHPQDLVVAAGRLGAEASLEKVREREPLVGVVGERDVGLARGWEGLDQRHKLVENGAARHRIDGDLGGLRSARFECCGQPALLDVRGDLGGAQRLGALRQGQSRRALEDSATLQHDHAVPGEGCCS